MKYLCLVFVILVFQSCDDRNKFLAGRDVSIASMTLITFPPTNNGLPWDNESLPDFAFTIENENAILQQSITEIDVSESKMPLKIEINDLLLPSLNKIYFISLLEVDSIKSNPIGSKISFDPEAIVNEFKKNNSQKHLPVVLNLENNSIKIQIHFIWDTVPIK